MHYVRQLMLHFAVRSVNRSYVIRDYVNINLLCINDLHFRRIKSDF
jgi:hypothetical protein